MKPLFASGKSGTVRREGRCRGILSAFGRDRRGATAVEFSLVALPFLALVGGILELGLTTWARALLQDGVTAAARQIYTGNFQQSNSGTTNSTVLLTNFRNTLCRDTGVSIVALFNCNNVKVSIRQASSMSAASLTQASGSNNGWNPSFSNYTCGGAGSIMVVQAAIEFPIFFSLLGPGSVSNGLRIIQGVAVFKVEPYGSQCS